MFPPVAPRAGEKLCALADIPDGGTWSHLYGAARDIFPVVVARKGAELIAYVNVCPHQFLPLDGYMGEFLTDDGEYLYCMQHGAVFRLNDGVCVAGPCGGRRLLGFNVEVRGEDVVMGRWPDAPARPPADPRDHSPPNRAR